MGYPAGPQNSYLASQQMAHLTHIIKFVIMQSHILHNGDENIFLSWISYHT